MKIGIYGAGFVGSTVAYSLCLLNLAEEILIYDKNYEKTIANIIDIQDGLYNNINIYYVDMLKLSKCDIIIVCVGNSMFLKEEKGRYKEKNITNNAIEVLCKQLKKDNYNGFIINVSNPNDIISYNIYKILKNKKRIFGTGTWLDTNRLNNIIKYLSIIGEHGKGVINNNYVKLLEDRYNTIIKGKGFTNFGISKIVCDIVQIIQQKKPQKVVLSVFNGKNFSSKQVILDNEGIDNNVLY